MEKHQAEIPGMEAYRETVDYLYSQTPQFQRIGAAAYKPGLDTVISLNGSFGDPAGKLRVIHVTGTNGKGSVSHSIAAVLQKAGYRTGLFTSPHLVDFRERIRINGQMIPHREVVDFVSRFRKLDSQLKPSFFELTTVMAFDWFAREGVDFAVIEVGLGGRLDSTNILTPLLSVITNISFDHTAQLGNTLAEIAGEKAGIIKRGVPVVIGEADGDVKEVFLRKSEEVGAPIEFADTLRPAGEVIRKGDMLEADTPFGHIAYNLTGYCQEKNLQTIITALGELRNSGIEFSDDAVREGLADVTGLTGLAGRWMKVADNPLTICDTGHNEGGWRYLSRQLEDLPGELVMVLGFVNDKDISHIIPLIPAKAKIIYTRASVPRALPADELAAEGARLGRPGITAPDVATALRMARDMSPSTIFVGGSTFIVADLLTQN